MHACSPTYEPKDRNRFRACQTSKHLLVEQNYRDEIAINSITTQTHQDSSMQGVRAAS